MAFGFDPSLILAQRPFDSEGMARTFADMSRLRMQQQQGNATLADMAQQRDQKRMLADIVRQNSGNPEAVGQALMRGGFGEQALDWQGRQAELQTRQAQGQSAMQDSLRKRVELMARPLHNGLPKNQQELDQLRATWKGLGFSETDMAGTEVFHEQETPQLLQQIRALGIPGDEQIKMAESERHNRAMEGRPPGMMPIVLGEGGTQYFANPLNPGTAKQITDEHGNPINKPAPAKQPRALTTSDRDKLDALRTQVQAARELAEGFQDSFAGKGFMGAATVAGKQMLGSWGSDADQKEAAWWANFAKWVDLPERNKTFGSSLTATEKGSWEGAKNIKPGADPKLVRAQIARMEKISADAMARRGRSLAKDGFTAEAIEEYTGPLGLGEAPAAGASPKPGLTPAEAAELSKLEAKFGAGK